MALAILIGLASCTSDHLETFVINENCNKLDSVISFSSDILPVFAANCNQPGCHSGSAPEGNLNLEASQAYAQLNKRGGGYIDTINPKRSVLYSSIVSTSDPMPPGGQLDACTISLIENWMKQGAKNN